MSENPWAAGEIAAQATTGDDFYGGPVEKRPAVKFTSPGQALTFKIDEPPSRFQGYEYNPNPNAPKVPKTWKDGNPRYSYAIAVTGVPSGEKQTLYMEKLSRLHKAIIEASRRSGVSVVPGGFLTVQFVGFDGPAKTYHAELSGPEA